MIGWACSGSLYPKDWFYLSDTAYFVWSHISPTKMRTLAANNEYVVKVLLFNLISGLLPSGL